ncbi:MAG: 16S rRNA (cytosine(1402)-N(4))-methyltransferase [Tenericutes bacterium]|nr:MAG: 16S rRNA (cytosine(1402)-N(4))-methyltransferase [Mycoplasmatota bacterium]
MNQNSKKHISVLASETIKKLNLKKEGIYVDATLGMGGHSKMIAPNVNKLIVFDQDINAINQAKLNLSEFTNITFVHDNFSNMKARIEEMGISKVDGILFDLGTSFYQLTDPDRGFTYHGETTLDMRMNQSQELDAKIVLNEYSEEDLANIF